MTVFVSSYALLPWITHTKISPKPHTLSCHLPETLHYLSIDPVRNASRSSAPQARYHHSPSRRGGCVTHPLIFFSRCVPAYTPPMTYAPNGQTPVELVSQQLPKEKMVIIMGCRNQARAIVPSRPSCISDIERLRYDS